MLDYIPFPSIINQGLKLKFEARELTVGVHVVSTSDREGLR